MKITTTLLEYILKNAAPEDWSVQGFGMLRLYLTREIRLHIWCNKFMVPGASMIHDHPWDFESHILVGQLTNTVFKETNKGGTTMYSGVILTGEGAKVLGTPKLVSMTTDSVRVYHPGDVYHQYMNEVHSTKHMDGTVTVVYRKNRQTTDQGDLALSYWSSELGPDGWVSAAPRQATMEEVNYGLRKVKQAMKQ